MHVPALALLLVCAFVAPSPAAEKDPDEADLRRAVDTLADKPLSKKAADAAAVIVTFGEKSDAVAINISKEVTPWMEGEGTPHSDLLLAAFIGGNARGQLDAGVTRDDPWSGTLQVLRVYRALQAADPKLKVPAVDELLEELRDGKLAARLLAAPKAPAK